jgi:hypothetical protein
MTENRESYQGVRALADELGAEYTLDPTITPMMDGDRSTLNLNTGEASLRRLFRDETYVGDADKYCAPPPPPTEDDMESLPCSAGHTRATFHLTANSTLAFNFPCPAAMCASSVSSTSGATPRN